MERLNSVVTEKYSLEVIECDCGFHIGVDATYLMYVGDITIVCPSCGAEIDTEIICPEEEKEWFTFNVKDVIEKTLQEITEPVKRERIEKILRQFLENEDSITIEIDAIREVATVVPVK